ncbi:MAG: iron-sulfur cluster repair di-iron protein, partial [Armatimonadetes bacterium RBG_16_58_9]
IAARYPQSLKVFERHGIDYCCGGHERLADAVARQNITLDRLVAELKDATSRPPQAGEAQRDWTTATVQELIDHIVARHHTYLRAELPALDDIMAVVARVHGPAHGDVLRPLQGIFRVLKAEIEDHLRKEEEDLFPAIRRIGEGPASQDGKLRDLVEEVAGEHDRVGAALHEMRERTSDYALPTDACPTFARLYEGLNGLEKDVHQHIHLENNILFPRVVEAVGKPEAR